MTAADDRLRITGASIRVDSMPVHGRDLQLVLAAEDRAALAHHLDIVSVEHAEVKLHAVRFRGGFRVTGRLLADVTQQSVVSLEPVPQHISEPVDRVFLPGGEKAYAGPANAEIFVDLEGEDLPDHFEGNEADLSDLVLEVIALALDPYPRAEGEALDLPQDDAEAEKEHPFAALGKLKPASDKG